MWREAKPEEIAEILKAFSDDQTFLVLFPEGPRVTHLKRGMKDARLYIFQKAFKEEEPSSSVLWIDLDLPKERVKEILSREPIRPSVVVFTGRYYAFLYLLTRPLKYSEHKKIHVEMIEYFTNLAGDKNLVHQHCNPKSEHIRAPLSINTKTNKVVRWYIPGVIIRYTPEELSYFKEVNDLFRGTGEAFPSVLLSQSKASHFPCALLSKLDELWEYHTYEAWRYLSYAYASRPHEFIQKSSRWRGEQRQTPEERLRYSLKELQDNADDVYSCRTLSHKSLDEINVLFLKGFSLGEHPCLRCVFREMPLKPHRIVDDFVLEQHHMSADRRVFTKKGNKPVCGYFHLVDISKIEFLNVTKYFVFLKNNQGELASFILPDEVKELTPFLGALKEDAVKNLMDDVIQANYPRIKTIPGYTGIWDGKWNITPVHYQGYMVDERLDCMVQGDFTTFCSAFRKAVEVLREKDTPEWHLPLMFSLTPLITNVTNYPQTANVAMFLIGPTGAGKTMLLKLANSLWRPASKFLAFASTSRAFLEYKIGRVKGLICLDEYFYDDEKKQMFFTLLNRLTRNTMMQTSALPNTSNILFTCELNRWYETFLEGGVGRRSIVVEITGIPSEIIDLTNVLSEHGGFLHRFEFNFDYSKVNSYIRQLRESRLSEYDAVQLYHLAWGAYLYQQLMHQMGVELSDEEVILWTIWGVNLTTKKEVYLPSVEPFLDLVSEILQAREACQLHFAEAEYKRRYNAPIPAEFKNLLKVFCDNISYYPQSRSTYCSFMRTNPVLRYKRLLDTMRTKGEKEDLRLLTEKAKEEISEMLKRNIDKVFARYQNKKQFYSIFSFFIQNYLGIQDFSLE